ncbi:MAG: glycerol-3-phosphate 1-O-acyltransferase PlsY [Gammaproteobacteria bacterium]|nr:glycerol-3-phosphate 1-O-acyltransferase PlsY [Gammaproteobacteria bacterium]
MTLSTILNGPTLVGIAIAYLFGSISSAIIICKLWHLPDPRTTGSRNPGATNVLRVGGKLPALLTLLGDALKGVIPVFVAQRYGLTPEGVALIAFAVFLGHLYPIFFRFEGGKGVATALGCLFVLSWPVALLWVVNWLILAYLFRYSSLAAIVATFIAPFDLLLFQAPLAYCYGMFSIALMLIVRHRTNMINLWHGTERKIGKTK